MIKRLTLVLLSLLLAAFMAIGCGDDDEESSGAGGGSSQEAPADSGADTPEATGPAAEQAVEGCKQSISAQAQLSADVKPDLEAICEEAASGDEDAVRKASKDVCIKIVEETAPAGPAREQALTSCDQATQAP